MSLFVECLYFHFEVTVQTDWSYNINNILTCNILPISRHVTVEGVLTVIAMGAPKLVYSGFQFHSVCYTTSAAAGRAGALLHCTLSTDPGRTQTPLKEKTSQPEQSPQTEEVGEGNLMIYFFCC